MAHTIALNYKVNWNFGPNIYDEINKEKPRDTLETYSGEAGQTNVQAAI